MNRIVQLLLSPLLFSLAGAALALLLFAGLADEMLEGDTQRFDDWARMAVHGFASPTLTMIMRLLTVAGSIGTVAIAAVGAASGFWIAGRRHRAALMIVSLTGAALLMFVLKLCFHRVRPDPFFGTPLPSSYSFPSGHALVSFCVYSALAAFATAHVANRAIRTFLWTLAAVLVLGIGFSRVYLGVHYASDVAAGYLAALVWTLGVWAAYRRVSRGTPGPEGSQ